MADAIEHEYNIPLRKEWSKASRGRRAKRAIHAVQDFIKKHMKSDNILLGPKLNENIWSKGMQSPPHHVKVLAVRNKEGEVRVELVGHKFEKKVKEEKSSGLMDRVKEKAGIKDDKPKKKDTEKKVEKTETVEKKEEVKDEAKETEPKVETEKPAEPKTETKVEEKKEEVKETKEEVKPAEEKKVEEKKEAPAPKTEQKFY